MFNVQSGALMASAGGPCLEPGKDQGWQVAGPVELPTTPYLKFTTCGSAQRRADGFALMIN